MTTTPRKGATRRADVPADVLARLNAGTLETATLAEGLCVDFAALFAVTVPSLADVGREALSATSGVTTRMKTAGLLLASRADASTLDALTRHASDTVRGWAAYAVAELPSLTLADRLARLRPLADDAHFGVREWAWLAIRPRVAAELGEAIRLLTPWTADPSANVRRFASEVTRPRGVWCAHLGALKASPELGLPILEPLRADGSKYVRDSVANWLNDAGKTKPAWVNELCARWLTESDTTETRAIITRARRGLKGEGE